MRRSAGVVAVLLALVAVLTIDESSTGGVRARPASQGGRLGALLGLSEAQASMDHALLKHGDIHPDVAAHAILSGQRRAATIRTAAAFGGRWAEVGPRPYETANDPDDDPPHLGYPAWDGHGHVSGRARAMAIDPSDPSGKTVLVGTSGGGVWRTRDGGVTWTPLMDASPSLAIGALAFDRTRPRRVFAGTGEATFGRAYSFGGTGVYRSLDGGTTWQRPARNVGGTVVSRIAVSGETVFAATNRGLWRSVNGGASWHDVRLPTDAAGKSPSRLPFGSIVSDVVIQPGRPAIVTAAVGWMRGKEGSEGNGLYRSERSGAPGSWRRIDSSGLTTASKSDDPIGRISLAHATGPGQDPDILWAVVQDAGMFRGTMKGGVRRPMAHSLVNGVYLSRDNGTTWEVKATGDSLSATAVGTVYGPVYGAGFQAWANQVILVSPRDPNVVILGFEELYQTTTAMAPGAASWRLIGRYANECPFAVVVSCGTSPVYGVTTHPDQHSAAFTADGTRVYIGGDGGVYVQDNALGVFDNDHWRSANSTLGTTLVYYAAVARDGTIYAGFQDNGTGRIRNGVARQVHQGDGGYTAVEPHDSNRAWHEYIYGAIGSTKDGGETWNDFSAPALRDAMFIAPFKMDPLDHNHVVLGGSEIVETTRGVETQCLVQESCDWLVSFELGRNVRLPARPLFVSSAIDVHGSVVYAGYCGGCGASFTDLHGVEMTSGIATNRKPGCRPAPGDASCWHHAAARRLPERLVTDIAIDPRNPSRIVVTLAGYSARWRMVSSTTARTGKGHVFLSTDAGETFRNISANLPDLPAESVEMHGDRLFVGTHAGIYTSTAPGRAWERVGRGLPNSPVTDIDIDPQRTKLLVSTYGRGMWVYELAARSRIPAGP